MARIFPSQAADLLAGDAIEWNNEIALVIGLDPLTADGLLPIVTEDVSGTQYVDYIDPLRTFATIR